MAAKELVRMAAEQGLFLTSPDGLPKQFTKTVLTEGTGRLHIGVPRDRDGTFRPVIVRKHRRRLNEADEIVLSLYAHGLTTGEISAHFAQIYGAQVSKETILKDYGQGVRGDGVLGQPATLLHWHMGRAGICLLGVDSQ